MVPETFERGRERERKREKERERESKLTEATFACTRRYSPPRAQDDDESSASSLQRLKLEAWRSLRGKSQEAAMEKYLSLVTSLAPNWKVAHIITGRQSAEDRRKPREMMWVLRIAYGKRTKEDRLESAAALPRLSMHITKDRMTSVVQARSKTRGLKITSIDVLQSSNEANAKLWSENETSIRKVQRAIEGSEVSLPSEMDSYMAKLPQDLTLSDCIIDKSAHATIEEQRAYFAEQMRTMAEGGRDEEEGWGYFSKTIEAGLPDDEQLDVYTRSVKWSSTSQLRTDVETEFQAGAVFAHLFTTFLDSLFTPSSSNPEQRAAKATLQAAKRRTGCHPFLEKAEDGSFVTAIYYTETAFPWCVPTLASLLSVLLLFDTLPSSSPTPFQALVATRRPHGPRLRPRKEKRRGKRLVLYVQSRCSKCTFALHSLLPIVPSREIRDCRFSATPRAEVLEGHQTH